MEVGKKPDQGWTLSRHAPQEKRVGWRAAERPMSHVPPIKTTADVLSAVIEEGCI